jgi:hypothetical protein
VTRFLDGPAAGVTLLLGKAPFLLRVVKGEEWDALDQFDDEPRPGEEIFVYVRVTTPTTVHVDFSRPRRGGWYQAADYRLCAIQPTRKEAEDAGEWRAWCRRFAEQVAPAARPQAAP